MGCVCVSVCLRVCVCACCARRCRPRCLLALLCCFDASVVRQRPLRAPSLFCVIAAATDVAVVAKSLLLLSLSVWILFTSACCVSVMHLRGTVVALLRSECTSHRSSCFGGLFVDGRKPFPEFYVAVGMVTPSLTAPGPVLPLQKHPHSSVPFSHQGNPVQ